MKNRFVTSTFILAFGLTGCAQMNVAKKPYTPELNKKIHFTLDVPMATDKKELISVKIAKADLLDEKYSVNDCGTPAPAPATNQAAPAAPATNLLGSLASLASNVQTTAAAKATTPAGTATNKVIEKNYLPENMIAFKIDIKSDINHVINFEKAYFLLKDPNGNLHKAVSIGAEENWSSVNWCATKEQSKKYYDHMNSIYDIRSTMVLPLDSVEAYVAFAPGNRNIPGDWKLEIYEVPVATNAAGITSITDHFKAKAIVRKWETTFKKSTPTGAFEKVGTVEIN